MAAGELPADPQVSERGERGNEAVASMTNVHLYCRRAKLHAQRRHKTKPDNCGGWTDTLEARVGVGGGDGLLDALAGRADAGAAHE